ncbi:hypothetical protein ES705_38665 [subsurface metagenome]
MKGRLNLIEKEKAMEEFIVPLSERKRVIYEQFVDGIYKYTLEGLPCKQPKCQKCPHGRYWYARFRVGERPFCIYIGKILRLIKIRGQGSKEIDVWDRLKAKGVDVKELIAMIEEKG